MSEFELSTLMVVAMLLGGLGGYSYWQIRRAQSRQRKPIEGTPVHTGALGAESTHTDFGANPHTATEVPLHRTSPDDLLASAVQSAQDSKRYESVQNAYVPTGVGYALQNESDDNEDVYIRSTAPVISPSPPVYGSKSDSAYDVKPLKENHYAYTPEFHAGVHASVLAEAQVQPFAQGHVAAGHSIEDDIISYHDTLTPHVSAFESSLESSVAPPAVPSIASPVDVVIATPAEAHVDLSAQAHAHASVPVPSSVESPVQATAWPDTALDAPVEDLMLAADPQFFNQKDLTEQATFSVFDPLIRFSSWIEHAHPSPIQAIDGVLDVMVSQPKNAHDIERALYDLRLDTDLPLRLYGLRAGQVVARHSEDTHAARQWQPLEQGVLYSGLRLTLQLANASSYASTQLIHDWFELAQRLARRLAAHVNVWPDPAALASYAVYLHDVSKRLGAPLVVQLRKPQGLWAAYEVHQQMTQWGLQLDANGQYVARHRDGHVLYRVLNDLNNPRAQDFYRDALATMHVQTLSFCLDLARVKAEYQPQERLWHDMHQLAHDLKAQWCNGMDQDISPEILFTHAAEHVPAYIQQLSTLGVPAGSLTMRRLLRK